MTPLLIIWVPSLSLCTVSVQTDTAFTKRVIRYLRHVLLLAVDAGSRPTFDACLLIVSGSGVYRLASGSKWGRPRAPRVSTMETCRLRRTQSSSVLVQPASRAKLEMRFAVALRRDSPASDCGLRLRVDKRSDCIK